MEEKNSKKPHTNEDKINYSVTKEKHIKKKQIPIIAQLIMASDSLSSESQRTRDKFDKSGKIATKILINKNARVLPVKYFPDEKDQIKKAVEEIAGNEVNLIITIGGTGLAQRDVTIEAIEPLFEKKLPGFGELFRYLTYKEVGTVSMMTRAAAGIFNHTLIVCLPGSPNAVKLGVELILKEITHIFNHI